MKAHYAAFARYNAWANRRLYLPVATTADFRCWPILLQKSVEAMIEQ